MKRISSLALAVLLSPLAANAELIILDGSPVDPVWSDFVLTGEDLNMDNLLTDDEVLSVEGFVGDFTTGDTDSFGNILSGVVVIDTIGNLTIDLLTLIGLPHEQLELSGLCDGSGSCPAGARFTVPTSSTFITWSNLRSAQVPEPSTLTLLGLALAGLGLARRNRV